MVSVAIAITKRKYGNESAAFIVTLKYRSKSIDILNMAQNEFILHLYNVENLNSLFSKIFTMLVFTLWF